MAIDDEDISKLVNNKSFVDMVLSNRSVESAVKADSKEITNEVDRDNVISGEILERAEMSLALGTIFTNLRMEVIESDLFTSLRDSEFEIDLDKDDKYFMLEGLLQEIDNEIYEMGEDYEEDSLVAKSIVANGSVEEKEEFLSNNKESNLLLVSSFKDQLLDYYTIASGIIVQDKEIDDAFSKAIGGIGELEEKLEGNLVDNSGKQVRGIIPKHSHLGNRGGDNGPLMH